MAKRLDFDVVGFRSARGEALGRAVTAAAEAASDCLTFELSGRRRQDARPGLAKMYRVPPDRAWWPAVGAPLERRVRPCCALIHAPSPRGMFCATRHKTPLGSNSVKSRMAQGWT